MGSFHMFRNSTKIYVSYSIFTSRYSCVLKSPSLDLGAFLCPTQCLSTIMHIPVTFSTPALLVKSKISTSYNIDYFFCPVAPMKTLFFWLCFFFSPLFNGDMFLVIVV